ncbi:MAG: DMT family protein [Bacteroidales bacterium]|nr:DMT family protein [Bacteroidales bacterium]
MKSVATIFLLLVSNIFMTLAWYGHLKFKDWSLFTKYGLVAVILFSWSLALFEYIFQVPANRIGYAGNNGPFNLMQLKVLQEVITLIVFVIFSLIMFKNESLRWNHFIALIFLVLAVYFVFKK